MGPGPVLPALSHQTPAHLVSPVVAGPSSQTVNPDSGINHAVNPVVSSSTCGPARTMAQSLRHRTANTVPPSSRSSTTRTASKKPCAGRDGYRSWSLVLLKDECRNRRLRICGTKAMLISRLEDDDGERGVPVNSSPGAPGADVSGSSTSDTRPGAAPLSLAAAREITDGLQDEAIQSAFITMSARLKDLEETIRSQSAQFRVIVRQTVPFSPTKKGKFRPSILTAAASRCSVAASSSQVPSSVPSSPAACSCVHTCSDSAPSAPLPQTLQAARSEHHSEHVPILVRHASGTSYVLPLSPPLRTPFDLILPPPAAFCAAETPAPALFPSFDTACCTWPAMFKMISRPDLLWDCWGPRSLGAYPDTKSLWEAWDEGTSVEGVGRAPPLRLVESEWGRHEDQRTGKGKLPAWRPRMNMNARQRWSLFMALVKRVEDEMANGKTASAAVEHLDHLRDGRSLPQLRAALRPKGRRPKKQGGEAAATPSSVVPPLPPLQRPPTP
ncbi:hypothetical protein EDB89DRAFT_1969777 [Lactarius sanguifluus]|nr:hypothetical protein EDB89DRAFT_1969777 [Lactarius sanguifluus]